MDRLASCIRRDCNYYNVDNILANSHFDEEKGESIFAIVYQYVNIVII